MNSLGIWIVRQSAEPIAARLQARLGGTVYGATRTSALCHDQKSSFRSMFEMHSSWVLIMTTGIAVRYLDGLAKNKMSDPAVVVLDEGCHFAISLLSGHEGGANKLAFEVAAAVNATPVITTATESLKPLVAGVGCRRGVSAQTIEQAVQSALGEREIQELREIATIDRKSGEPGLLEFCSRHNLPLRILSTDTIACRSWVTKPSAWVKENIGTDGVCEPCALIANPRGRLLVPKKALNGVAVAIVEDHKGWDI